MGRAHGTRTVLDCKSRFNWQIQFQVGYEVTMKAHLDVMLWYFESYRLKKEVKFAALYPAVSFLPVK